MSAAPTPPWHNTEDVVVALDVLLVEVLGAVMAVDAGAELDRTVGTGAVIVVVDAIMKQSALTMLTVLRKKKLQLQLQKKTEQQLQR